MVDDLSDAWAEIRALKKDIERLKAANPLEAASVTKGRVRFIGGELRIDSGGRLIIEGTLSVDGVTTVTGSFTVSGPWNLTGNGTITGNVTISGKLVQNGEWELNGNGKIQGNVDVVGGGKIKAGNVEIVPSSAGGSVNFGDSRGINAGSGFLGFYDGTRFIVFNASGIALNAGGPNLVIGSSSIQVIGLPTVPQSSLPGSFIGALAVVSGELRRVVA